MKNKTKAKQRSMKHLSDNGWQVADVEKWIPPRGEMKFGVRKDVWGFGDILACSAGGKFALVQTFPLARWNDHIEKIDGIPEAKFWKACGGLILVHGWRKGGPKGQPKRWLLREEFL